MPVALGIVVSAGGVGAGSSSNEENDKPNTCLL